MAWPALKELRLRAPARHHKWCSSLKAWNKLSKLGLAPSKTHAFRCFQMIQAPNTTNVLKPFRLSFWIFLALFPHQYEKENLCLKGTQSCQPKLDRTRNQKSLVNTQVVSICWISSASWWQNKQCSGWGRFLLAKRSAVQHLFLTANHRKILHFAGAHVFQILWQGSNVVAPLKKAKYADLAVYCPEASNLQMWMSSSWVSTKSDRISASWNNSYSPIKDKPPCMSCTHLWSTKASATRRMLRARVGTAANTVGARSLIELPWIHLSVQNLVVDPLPIVVCKAIWKSAATLACIGISRDSQGLLVSVFLSQSHLTCNAQPMISRFRIPKPPNSSGLCTFSQATRQQPPCTSRLPFQRKALWILYWQSWDHKSYPSCSTRHVHQISLPNRQLVTDPFHPRQKVRFP